MFIKSGVLFYFFILLFLFGMANAQLMQNGQVCQVYPGLGTLGQITMSQYRDGDKIPLNLHTDFTFFRFNRFFPNNFGIEYISIPFHPDAPYQADGVFNNDWWGYKEFIMGNIGWGVYRESQIDIDFSINGGWSWINVSWTESFPDTGLFQHRNDRISGFTLGGSAIGRVNIPCTPVNFWGKFSYYHSFFKGNIHGVLSPSKEASELVTLMVGFEVNLCGTCFSPSYNYSETENHNIAEKEQSKSLRTVLNEYKNSSGKLAKSKNGDK